MRDSIYNTDFCTVHLSELMPLISERLGAGLSVRFSPKGYSMLPMLRSGKDAVTLTPIVKPLKKYDIVLFKRDDGNYVLHRIVAVGQTLTCIGDNQFVAERNIQPQQIIAVVSAFSRHEREHSVCEFGYKLYCRAWHYSRFFRRCLRAIYIRIKRLLKF